MLFNKHLYTLAIPLLCLIVLGSCNNNSTPPTTKGDSTATLLPADSSVNEYTTVYLAIADTGQDYYQLRVLMQKVYDATHIAIDTMDRYYSETEKEIVSKDNGEPEGGEYYPRREPSINLSLEYLVTYTPHSTNDNIVLLAAICETKKSADSLLSIIQKTAPNAFVLKGEVYMGCLD
jgi:hypothetical protein